MVYLASSLVYDYALKDANDNPVWTRGGVTAGIAGPDLTGTGPGKGGTLVGFIQSGAGSVSRTVQDVLQAAIVTPEQFGAVRDGVTDDQPAIARAIAYLSSRNGGTIDCQQGSYAIGSTVLVQASNITIKGRGADQFHNSGSGSLPSTVFKWIGATGGEVVRFETPAVVTSNKRNSGGMTDVQIDCNAVGGTGLRVQSWDRGRWVRIYVLNATQQAFKISCYTTGNMAEPTDSQQNFFEQCTWRMVDSGAVQNASGFVLTSDVNGSAGNTSFNTFHRCGGLNYNAYGYVLTDCDNNIFIGCGGTVLGTGFGVLLNGGYGNYFQGFSGTCRVYGTASGAWANSLNNVFYAVDESNGTVYPTVDAGCTLQWHGHKYGHYNLMSTKAVLSNTNANTLAQAGNLGTETLRLHNSSQNHVVLTDGTATWGIRITSDGALHMDRLAGTGTLQLGGDVSLGAYTGATDQAITGFVTIKDSAGNTRKLATIA